MRFLRLSVTPVLLAAACVAGNTACNQTNATGRVTGQSDFVSAPAGGSSARYGGGLAMDGAAPSESNTGSASAGKSAVPRTVEETDIYRVEGDRLYYLNGYRGLMVFDVSNVDAPKFLGRSPIFGSPVEMRVKNGIASVVVADWYGKFDDGTPFHGSIVRGIDATNPAAMKITGEAKLGGWVRDTRVVGDVIYAVSEEQNYYYGWDMGYGGATYGSSQSKVMVTSVNVAGAPTQVGTYEDVGWAGVFNVTDQSIMFAHFVPNDATNPWNSAGHTELRYVDISDPGGAIKPRGVLSVDMYLSDWSSGADNGRWNLDFADKTTAHMIGCAQIGCNSYYYDYGTDSTGVGGGTASSSDSGAGGAGGAASNSGSAGAGAATSVSVTDVPKPGTPTPTPTVNSLVLVTADFSNPDAPTLDSRLSIPTANNSWSNPVARFTPGRMYLSPSSYDYYGATAGTPFQVYDLTNPAAPKLAGSTTVTGSSWLFMPAQVTDASGVPSDRIFIVGNDYDPNNGYGSSQVSVRYVDVSDAANPKVLGAANFGGDWAWTPASSTFKAFVMDPAQGLVVLPFSGWSSNSYSYNNGVQLVEFTPSSVRSAGAAFTKGWVQRGIFVKNRVVSLSDQALAVIDATDHDNPKTIKELTLARNVVDAKPSATQNTIAELSSDWWDNDKTTSQLRIVPANDVAELHTLDGIAGVDIEGYNAQVFHNGTLSYVVTNVDRKGPCLDGSGSFGVKEPGVTGDCNYTTQQVQVVDVSGAVPKLLGKVALPNLGYGYYYGGYFDCFGWYNGASAVQVEGDALAFRRWIPTYYNPSAPDAGAAVDVNQSGLFIVDLKNPSAPKVASTIITDDPYGWWGSLKSVGNQLYTSSYEWFARPDTNGSEGTVKYYLNQIDLSDRSAPKVKAKINVPGVLVGGSDKDPSILYTVDYRWMNNNQWTNDLDVLKVQDGVAYLQGQVEIKGDIGTVFVQGEKALTSAQTWNSDYSQSKLQLAQIDMTNPAKPTLALSTTKAGWGWLMAVEGDRAFVTSGWGSDGLDVYRLGTGAPVFDQTLPTRNYWASDISRKGSQVFISSGYYGVQAYDL